MKKLSIFDIVFWSFQAGTGPLLVGFFADAIVRASIKETDIWFPIFFTALFAYSTTAGWWFIISSLRAAWFNSGEDGIFIRPRFPLGSRVKYRVKNKDGLVETGNGVIILVTVDQAGGLAYLADQDNATEDSCPIGPYGEDSFDLIS